MAFPPSTRRNEPPILPVRQGPPIQLPLRDITDSDTDAPPQRPHPAVDTVARCGPWAYPPPLPSSWLRNGASGLRVRHDFPLLLLMIRGVVSPDPEASTDR